MLKNFFITSFRNLRTNKIFSFLNICGLSLGITTCLVIGVWLQRELSFDNFHPRANHIFRLANTFKSESESFSQAPSGPAFGARLPGMLPEVKSACRIFNSNFNLKAGNDFFVEPDAAFADSNFFNFFGFKLIKGNAATALQSATQIVLTEKLAIKYFGNQDAMGKTMIINKKYPVTVSGVAADFPVNSQLQMTCLLSTALLKSIVNEQSTFDMDNQWVGGWPLTYVQLADPLKYKHTETLINEIAARASEKEWKANKMSYHYFLQPLTQIHLHSNLRYDTPNNGSLSRVRIFSIVGIIVLLLACINYINLTTAGAIKRAKETSVRKVIGATRKQLIAQFFAETFLICTAAVVISLFLLNFLLPAFSQWSGQPYHFSYSIPTVLLMTGFIVLIAALAGIYPAVVLSSFRPATALKGNFSQSIKGNIIRKALVVSQFTITVTLIASILIIGKQMNFIKNKSLGFDAHAVLEINFNGEATVPKQYASLRNNLMRSPYILNTSMHEANIVGGMGNGWTTTENGTGATISTSLYQMAVDSNYFDTYNMKLAAGRFFSRDIPSDTAKAVLVNEAAVRTFGWQTAEKAIGKTFGTGKHARVVIGVVRDFNFESLHKPVEALLIGYSRDPGSLSVKIDARHLDEAINHLKKAWAQTVQDVPLQYAFIDESIVRQYGNEQKMAGIFYGFAGLSLLIACMGLFGLSIFVVERKLKEIGIRKVLGASVSGIVALLSKDYLQLVLLSAVIACPIAWYAMHQWLQDFAYRISITWQPFVIAGSVAVIIALITISFRAIRAALANPVKSLRIE